MKNQPYSTVEAQPSFPEIERRVLARWDKDRTFQASVDARAAGVNGSNEFVFYDGPPFANGLPHYGHLLTGYVKDAVPRYRTMRGRRVERRFGWDCHGLPAEVEAERLLQVSGRQEIAELGIARFNEACRTSVLQYTSDWERYVTRQARWVDFANDYKTLDLPYMESVMWAFKTLWDKGLVYEGYKVLPYCWRCETPLSNTETRMDDVYRDRQDPAITVAFSLETGEKILAWTTTPWTLPSNLALAVGPDVDYAVVVLDGERYILAEARLSAYDHELGRATRLATVKGRDLVGRRYEPLFAFLAAEPNAFRVLAADFVSTEDGTGVVHMSPGHGEEDQVTCNANGIATVVPMDSRGRYTAEITPWADVHVFEANPLVIRDLKERGLVLRHETYHHSYPHCWRCAQPLVYRAISSWFVQVTAFRDRLVELNQSITWVPEHVRDGSFGKWLENARDWSISRNRFWGSPIPVWRSDDPRYPRIDVYGGLDELERDFGVRPDDLHRPTIDDLIRPNPDDPSGASMMRRVPEVLDCWFESGSMPFAQVHYPFENREWFEYHYPGDFIVEYIGQTRGWFYTLHVLATALFDRPAFRTCMAHGIVLGNDAQKMSKSLKNYPDPYEMFDTYGSDAMRWFLLASPILRGSDLVVTEQGIRDSVRQVINPLWNAWSFFTLYANSATPGGYRAEFRTDQTSILDRYLLAKLHDLVIGASAAMESYDLFNVCALIRGFLDVLTNWYIRRGRDRFWVGLDGGDDSVDAFDTLATAMQVLCRIAAPMLPLISEAIFTELTRARSVHLADWPEPSELPRADDLVGAMDRVREVCSAALAIRKARGLRVRLPLNSLTVATPDAHVLAAFTEIIADEVNVKQVHLVADVASVAHPVLAVVPAALGPRLGPDTQRVIKAVKAGDWARTASGRLVAGGVELLENEFTLRLVAVETEASSTLPGGDGVVVLDTVLTPELEAEGLARDLVRAIQQARRNAELDVSDRIEVTLGLVWPELAAATAAHSSFITTETLTYSIEVSDDVAHEANAEVDGRPLHVTVTKR